MYSQPAAYPRQLEPVEVPGWRHADPNSTAMEVSVARPRTIQSIDLDLLQDSKRDLLQIAELDPERMKSGRIKRSEIKIVLQRARAISQLVRQALMRSWDEVFLIVGTRVFLRFHADDLLRDSREDVAVMCTYLAEFCRWRDARLLLVGMPDDADSLESQDANRLDAVRAARGTLANLASTVAPSGESLDQLFLQWVTTRGLVRGVDLMLASANGAPVHCHMPPKMQLVKRLGAERVGVGFIEEETTEVLAFEILLRIETTAGEVLFVVPKHEGYRLAEGAILVFPEDATTPIGRWLDL